MTRKATTDQFHFEGFDNPNTTPVPDVVFDRFLARLGEAELKALLYIIRRTFGFKRDRDPISFNQFLRGITTKDGRVLDEGCGIKDRTSLSKALKALEEKGIVQSEKGVDERGENTTTVYMLRFKGSQGGVVGNSYQGGVVGNSYRGGMDNPLPVVGNSYPQETGLQETDSNRIDGGTRVRSHNVKEPATPTNGEGERAPRGGTGFTPITEVVTKRRRDAPATDPPDDDRSVLTAVLAPYRQEFADSATARASATRVLNLQRRSQVDRNVFIPLLAEAASRTRESVQLGTIEGHAFAYFLRVLEQLLHPDVAVETHTPPVAPQNARQAVPSSDPVSVSTSLPSPPHSASEGLTEAYSETHPVWKAVLSELRLVLTPANYNTWLATTKALTQEGNTLQVAVPRQFHADWLQNRLLGRITSTMERLGYGSLQVEFVVQAPGQAGSVTCPAAPSRSSAAPTP